MTVHRNNNVVELLRLSYENDYSAARFERRERPAILDQLYTPTRLDGRLSAAILNDEFDLVLITGNPGDGKTEYLAQLATQQRTRGDRVIQTLHDATQPGDDRRDSSAAAHLELFLQDLTDEHWRPDVRTVRVVGINEGMLSRTLLNPRGPYRQHLRQILRRLRDGRSVEERTLRVALINLNERALVHLPLADGGSDSDSLLLRLLSRMVDPALWEDGRNENGCAGCPAEVACPLLNNAQLLRLARPRRQLALTFAVAQFRRQRHVSLRDALAALSYAIVGHTDMFWTERGGEHPCDQIQSAVRGSQWAHLFRRLFYHGLLDDGDVFEGYYDELGGPAEGPQRLYGYANAFIADELNSLDPCDGPSNAGFDAIEQSVVLNPVAHLVSADAAWMENLTELERRFFGDLRQRLDQIDDDLLAGNVSDSDFVRLQESFARLSFVASRAALRRALFFDGGLGDGEATPYESLPEFLGILAEVVGSGNAKTSAAYDRAIEFTIPAGVAASERIPVPAPPLQALHVRLGRKDQVLGARLDLAIEELEQPIVHPRKARFGDLQSYHPGSHTEHFVEYFPTFAVYRPFRNGSREHLVLTLDLYELLFRLSRGYDEAYGRQHRVQQLRVFKGALRARESRAILVFDEETTGLQVPVRVQRPRSLDTKKARVRFQ